MTRRLARTREPRGRSLVGSVLEVDVGPVAHGGHCVARADGRVVFVRHALPGERVVAQVTQGGEDDPYLRADAVRILKPSPDRVPPPCPYAGPGLCGGCDFQHVRPDAQRRLKGAVVHEQLVRLAGLDRPVEVEAVPGDVDGLRWRTRIRWARTRDGRRGLRKHRSREVVPVDDCRIAVAGVRDEDVHGAVTERVRGHTFDVDAGGFWQVHPGAPEVLLGAVLGALAPGPGDHVVDLYAGVGLFSAFLAGAVGPSGRVVAVEGDRRAARHARSNLAAYPWVEVAASDVRLALPELGPADLVVLDPPRRGAGRAVVAGVAGLRPRAIAYVACDPAALARDTALLAGLGYGLVGLRAFDLFPMTHHVECVAAFAPAGRSSRSEVS